VAIGNSKEEAMEIYDRTIKILQKEAELIASRKDYFELDLKMIRPDANKISH